MSTEIAPEVWTAGLSADGSKYRFLHDGKKVTLFRRRPELAWELRRKVHGVDTWVGLDVRGHARGDLALAVKRAKSKIEEWRAWPCDGPRPTVRASAPKTASWGEIFARYEAGATAVALTGRVGTDTAAANVSALKRVVKWALGEELREGAPALALGEGRKLVDKFMRNYAAKVETAGHEGRNELAVDRRLNGAAHTLRKAASLFAPQKMGLYDGLALPDLEEFRLACRKPVRVRVHEALAPETVAAMDEAARKLEPRQWLIHLCLKHLGLRPKELLEARMDWFRQAAWGQWFFAVVVTEFSRPKASLGHTPLCAEVAKEIGRVRRELAEEGELTGADWLVPGKDEEDRRNAIYRTHSAFMRRFVPKEDFEGSSYELRRWALQTVRGKYGKDAASDFGRHAAKDVTQAHYLERVAVWRDRAPEGDAGISFADAKGRKAEPTAEKRVASGWEAMLG